MKSAINKYCAVCNMTCVQEYRQPPRIRAFIAHPWKYKTTYRAALKPFGDQVVNPFEIHEEAGLFCDICRHIRSSTHLIADISAYSLNVAFELGFAFGLDLPISILASRHSWELQPEIFKFIPQKFIHLYDDLSELSGAVEGIMANPPASLLRHVTASLPTLQHKSVNLFHNKILGPFLDLIALQLDECLKAYELPTGIHLSNAEDPICEPLYDCSAKIHKSASTVVPIMEATVGAYRRLSASLAFYAGMVLAQAKPVLILIDAPSAPRFSDMRGLAKEYETDTDIVRFVQEWLEGAYELIENRMADVRVAPGERSAFYEFNIGAWSAETDELVSECFYVTESIRQVLKGNDILVVGNRGVGKTATLQHLKKSLFERSGTVPVVFEPPYELMSGLVEIASNADLSKNPEFVLRQYWEEVLAFIACATCAGLDHVDAEFVFLQADAKNALEETGLVWSRTASMCLELLERYLEFDPGQSIQVQLQSRLHHRVLDQFHHMLSAMSVWVIVDEIDRVWTTESSQNASVLFSALIKLLHSLRLRNKKLKVTVFLRDDAYRLLMETVEDMQQLDTAWIKWSYEELSGMIASRIIHHFGVPLGKGDYAAWSRILDSPEAFDSRDFILTHSLHRPRYVITFLKDALEHARRRRLEIIRPANVMESFGAYRERVIYDMQQELKNQIPCLADFLAALEGFDTTNDLTIRSLLAKKCGVMDASAQVDLLKKYRVLQEEDGQLRVAKLFAARA